MTAFVHSNKRNAAGTLALILLAVAVIAFPSLFYPFGRDQAIHAYIAKLVGDGLVVYRDVFNVKPPMTTFIHWLSQALFGETMYAIRLLDVAIIGTTSILLQLIVTRHLRSYGAGITAAIAYATYHFSNDYWTTAQTDGWCGLFIVASVLAYSHALDSRSLPSRLSLFALAGIAIGVSFWIKYTSAAAVLMFPAVHIAKRIVLRDMIRDGVAVSAGFAACIASGLLVLHTLGALPSFLDIQDFMRSYVSNTERFWILLLSPILVLNGAKLATVFAMLGIYITIKSVSNPRYRVDAIGLLVWLAAGYLSGILQGKGFKYHFLPLYPALAIMAAIGVFALVTRVRQSLDRNVATLGFAVACTAVVLFSQVPKYYAHALPFLRGEISIRDHWMNTRYGHERHNMRENMAVADYLHDQLLPCERVFIWGYQPSIYFLSGRRLVSRFIYNFPMFAAFYRQAYRDEFMDVLRSTPPEIFIVEHGDRTPHVSIHNYDSAEVMEQFTALKRFVADNYTFREKIARFDIYFRNDIIAGAPRACPEPTSR